MEDVLSRPAEEFENDNLIETLWATRAYEHAEVYFNLISSVNTNDLKLTPFDDQIYSAFRLDFPKMNIGIVDENDMKSAEGKSQWRQFISKFDKIEDYSVGTLLRIYADREFNEDNTIFVIRLQFLAIEIARNREGYNDNIRNKYKPKIINNDKDEKNTVENESS